MKRIEGVLEVAMAEKGKTLRPEIQLMNKVLLVKPFCIAFNVVGLILIIFFLLRQPYLKVATACLQYGNHKEWWLL